ncbi:MAG: carboxypeptidase-like regulatory domain-containing protein [Candidatus Sulfotelmatobacter sp.]
MQLNSTKLFLMVLLALLLPGLLVAQSTTNGAISGTVTDASGAILPDITVNLKSTEKGFTNSTKTNAQGFYQFPLLEPGGYAITISAPSFKTSSLTTTVNVGSTSIVNAKLEVGSTGTTVEVTSEAALLQTESSEISTTFNAREISEVPNPGNDLSFVAQTAAGSVMNTGMGFGNFASFGVSASSNLFTLNGMYDNDPFLNVNNSGATNLLLGNNEVQEATVVTNGYSGQYGGFAGANVNYITKSGSNNWHGNANYWWDGRVMNANNFFNVGNDTPRPFVNANQYAASFGGPIKKDKAFFFWNYEGLRVILPTSEQVITPTQGFENFITDNLNSIGLSQSVPFYNQMFGLYNNAIGISRAVPGVPTASDTSGCQGQSYANAAGTFGAGASPCAQSWRGTASNFTHEYLTSGRFDFNVTSNDRIFVRLQEDKGVQATATDQINPLFNAYSTQPEYQGQVSWNRAFGVKAANNLVISDQYYSAIFSNANRAASLAAFPNGTMLVNDGSLTILGGDDVDWPQGRNVTGYQVVDDYSYSLGSQHTLKLGVYFHRNLVSDHDYGANTAGIVLPLSLNAFAYGGFGTTPNDITLLQQSFETAPEQNIKLYQLGWYLQDEWKVKSNLKLTFALRADHNSIPTCQANCFARFSSPFTDIDHDPTVPYNQVIQTGQHQAMQSFTTIAWQPRFGFSYSPFGSAKTVIRGGVGLFMDTFPGQVADGLSQNSPVYNIFPFNIVGNLAPTQVAAGGLAGFSGNVWNSAAVTNAAIQSGFSQGLNATQIANNAAANGGQFAPPGFTNANAIQAPRYWEWNLELQRQVGNNTSVTVNYVGNHGYHETGLFNNENAYCPLSVCPSGFIGLPASVPDSRFGGVEQIQTVAVSNYNGLSFTAQHRFNHGLQMQVNYTWSHALDEISNGGFNQFIAGNAGVGRLGSVTFPINDNNLRQYNYGNADYDTRHYLSANYVYELPKGPTAALKGWQLSGTLFARSGLPYTVLNSGTSAGLGAFNYQSPAFANYDGPSSTPHCNSPSSVSSGPCLSPSLFPDIATGGVNGPGAGQLLSGTMNQRRNQFFGPHYFDTDMTIMKYTQIPRWESAKFGVGAQFFNLFNHPNFESPVNDINSGSFGHVLDTVNTPTSILGSFLGGDSSARLVQLTMKLNF